MKNKITSVHICTWGGEKSGPYPHGYISVSGDAGKVRLYRLTPFNYRRAISLQTHLVGLSHPLTVATDLIKVLSHNGLMPPNMMTDGGKAWTRWTEEITK